MADEKKQLSRVNVIREFLETERTYVKCLNQLHQVCKFISQTMPIQQHFIQNNASNLDPNLKELISQAEVVLQINGKFLNELESRLGNEVLVDTQVSDIVLNYATQFKTYTGYMNIQEDASEAYQKLITQIPQITEESNRLQKEAKTFVNFDSLSITPIQRVPRYIMLTKEILKHTPLDHQNREGLEKCMESLKETAKFLDEQVQRKIKKKRMFDLSTKIEGMTSLMQPLRQLLKEGNLTKIGRKSSYQYYLLLFSDILLVCNEKVSVLGNILSPNRIKQQSFIPQLPSALKLVNIISLQQPIKCIDGRRKLEMKQSESDKQNQQTQQHTFFLLLTYNHTLLFQAQSHEDVDEWINQINETREKIKAQKIEQKNKEEEQKKKEEEKQKKIEQNNQDNNQSQVINLFANAVAHGQTSSLNKIESVRYTQSLLKDQTKLQTNNNIEFDDNELEIIAPQDPVMWKDLLKHIDIEWNKIKYYNEKEQEKQDKLKLKQEKEKGKEKTRKMLEEILIQQTIKEEEEKGKKEGTILEELTTLNKEDEEKKKISEKESLIKKQDIRRKWQLSKSFLRSHKMIMDKYKAAQQLLEDEFNIQKMDDNEMIDFEYKDQENENAIKYSEIKKSILQLEEKIEEEENNSQQEQELLINEIETLQQQLSEFLEKINQLKQKDTQNEEEQQQQDQEIQQFEQQINQINEDLQQKQNQLEQMQQDDEERQDMEENELDLLEEQEDKLFEEVIQQQEQKEAAKKAKQEERKQQFDERLKFLKEQEQEEKLQRMAEQREKNKQRQNNPNQIDSQQNQQLQLQQSSSESSLNQENNCSNMKMNINEWKQIRDNLDKRIKEEKEKGRLCDIAVKLKQQQSTDKDKSEEVKTQNGDPEKMNQNQINEQLLMLAKNKMEEKKFQQQSLTLRPQRKSAQKYQGSQLSKSLNSFTSMQGQNNINQSNQLSSSLNSQRNSSQFQPTASSIQINHDKSKQQSSITNMIHKTLKFNPQTLRKTREDLTLLSSQTNNSSQSQPYQYQPDDKSQYDTLRNIKLKPDLRLYSSQTLRPQKLPSKIIILNATEQDKTNNNNSQNSNTG